MKRQGNMLIMTVMACALLALILVVGLEVSNLHKATAHNQLASLQMEQLHRSALKEGVKRLNEKGEAPLVGHYVILDEPLSGQKRCLRVDKVQGRRVVLFSESTLADGSARRHHVDLVALPKEARYGFVQNKQTLFSASAHKDVTNRWLNHHAAEDLVFMSDGALTIGSGTPLSDPLKGSMLICGWDDASPSAVLNSDLKVEGAVTCTGNLLLRHDLSCETAWIDGTLTIDKGIRLEAKRVYLAKDVPPEVLQCIRGTVYMPHPPEVEESEETPPSFEVKPLPEEGQPTPDKWLYLMHQQLD